ncbi:MAG TPA: hypothetical protein VNS88_12270 [Nitrospiraceae bacterium]|nr:hypothetical protein [Nitrospiraceae bacterium]
MTTTNMARLNDMVRISAPGALDGIIRMEVFNVLKDFFQRTNCWLIEVPVYIVATTNDYQIETGQNVIVNRLMGLGRLDSPPPLDGSWLSAYAPMCPPQYLTAAHGQGTEAQDPLFRTRRVGALLNPGTKCPILRIFENPAAEEVWVATLALNTGDPTDPDGFVSPPDWIVEKYLRHLASGVICQLMLQPAKPYSSLPGAQYHGRKFNEGVGLARTEIRHMFNYSGQAWAFPGGWNFSSAGSGL